MKNACMGGILSLVVIAGVAMPMKSLITEPLGLYGWAELEPVLR